MRIWFAVILAIFLSGCSSRAVRFQFVHGSEPSGKYYVAVTDNPVVIAKAREELKRTPDERRLHIQGPIAKGDLGYNKPWKWHFEESKWSLVELSIELCDAAPDYIDQNLADWLVRVKQYCPWASKIEREL